MRSTSPCAVATRRACGSPAPPATRRSSFASLLVDEPPRDRPVGVDAAVAQERPMPADGLLVSAIAGDDQRLLVGAPGLGQDRPERIGDEAAAPELDAFAV